jgi:hypothetical protein
MSDRAEMAERHDRILAELAEIGLMIARELQAQVLGAETPEVKAQAAASFPRVARAVRQSLALESRLRRDARREAAEVREQAECEFSDRRRRRKALVEHHIQRALCDETPDDEETVACRMEDLRDRLDDDLLDEDFVERPVDQVIAALCVDLGLAPPDLGPEPGDAPSAASVSPTSEPPPDPDPPGGWRLPYSSA